MSMTWFAILALVASPDGPSCRLDLEPGRPVAASVDQGSSPGPSCSLSMGRNVGHRPGSSPWSTAGPDEFDTEEQDETWMVHLDLLASVPVAWLTWARPRSPDEPVRIVLLHHSSPAHFPLRC